VTSDGNLQVKVVAPVSNSWLYLDGALINEETGAVDEFDVEVSYYSGSDSDGSWSEGLDSGTVHPARAPGRYTLRLEPQWEAAARRPNTSSPCAAACPASPTPSWPCWPCSCGRPALWRWFRFEVARWSESDHPGFLRARTMT
jgi:hypothetical protein